MLIQCERMEPTIVETSEQQEQSNAHFLSSRQYSIADLYQSYRFRSHPNKSFSRFKKYDTKNQRLSLSSICFGSRTDYKPTRRPLLKEVFKYLTPKDVSIVQGVSTEWYIRSNLGMETITTIKDLVLERDEKGNILTLRPIDTFANLKHLDIKDSLDVAINGNILSQLTQAGIAVETLNGWFRPLDIQWYVKKLGIDNKLKTLTFVAFPNDDLAQHKLYNIMYASTRIQNLTLVIRRLQTNQTSDMYHTVCMHFGHRLQRLELISDNPDFDVLDFSSFPNLKSYKADHRNNMWATSACLETLSQFSKSLESLEVIITHQDLATIFSFTNLKKLSITLEAPWYLHSDPLKQWSGQYVVPQMADIFEKIGPKLIHFSFRGNDISIPLNALAAVSSSSLSSLALNNGISGQLSALVSFKHLKVLEVTYFDKEWPAIEIVSLEQVLESNRSMTKVILRMDPRLVVNWYEIQELLGTFAEEWPYVEFILDDFWDDDQTIWIERGKNFKVKLQGDAPTSQELAEKYGLVSEEFLL